MSGWEDMGNPCVNDTEQTTFRTQGSCLFRTNEGRDILMCERHNTDNFLHCSYIWLPVVFTGDGRLELTYQEQIAL